MTMPSHNRVSTKNGWKSVLLETSTVSTKTVFVETVDPNRRWPLSFDNTVFVHIYRPRQTHYDTLLEFS